MSDTHAARPTDLVALVTFDGEIRRNQAVTREHLGRPLEAARPLSAALEQWLGFGRKTWITVDGRQIQGIATARELGARSAWQIDTLIDAGGNGATQVLHDLLRQAVMAAEHARVTHLLLRTPADSPAVGQAHRAGFTAALHERLWVGAPPAEDAPTAADGAGIELRSADEVDQLGLFQLYSRALPVESRETLAMTFDEWNALREHRWCQRGCAELVAVRQGRIVGGLRTGRADGQPQFELMAEREGDEARAATAALISTLHTLLDPGDALALVPAGSGAVEALLSARGFGVREEYILLARRIARPVRERARARAGIPITSR